MVLLSFFRTSAGRLKTDNPSVGILETVETMLDTIKPLQDLLLQAKHRAHGVFDRLEAMFDLHELDFIVAIQFGECRLCRHMLVRPFKVRNAFHVFDCRVSKSLE